MSHIDEGLEGLTSEDGSDYVDSKRWKKAQPFVIGTLAVAAVFVAWQLIAAYGGFSIVFLPTPKIVYNSFVSYVSTGQIWPDLRTTGKEFFAGYVIAVLVGVVVGLLAGWYRRLRFVISPYLSFFLSIPVIAITPLIIIWAGAGLTAKITIISLSGFFPIVISTISGVRNLDPRLIRLEQSYCATGFQLFRTLAVPGSVPFILAGMRLGIATSIVGTYVAEISSNASSGVGFMMNEAGVTYQTARVIVGVFIFGIAGIILTAIISLFQRRFQYGKA